MDTEPQQAAEAHHFTITPQQLTELIGLADKLYAEAELCRDASRWPAALIQLGGSIEAALLATVCVFEPELRHADLWPKGDPTKWTLGQLADMARKAEWLPTEPAETGDGLPEADDELFANLRGQIGDALRFVERLRNMVVHPGAYVREILRPDIDDEEHMRQTYRLIDGILAQVFDHLAKQMDTLPGLATPQQ